MVGTIDGWDIWGDLEERAGPLDREALEQAPLRARADRCSRPRSCARGSPSTSSTPSENDLKRAIVSSASRTWIDMHLERLERTVGWDAIVTADYDPQRAKPLPTLYLEALDLIGTEPGDAIAFEDSPNGAAAQARGSTSSACRTRSRAHSASRTTPTSRRQLADLSPDELASGR